MKSTTEVTREIRGIVRDRIDSGVVLRVDWLKTEIMAMKCNIEGDDADFYMACGVEFIKKTVSRVIGCYAPKAEHSEQIVMEGFDYLQKAYTVVRNDETTVVPLMMLSDDELEMRAQEYEAMAKGCIAHVKEIRAFIMGCSEAAA